MKIPNADQKAMAPIPALPLAPQKIGNGEKAVVDDFDLGLFGYGDRPDFWIESAGPS
jgi:hypothetical protein